MATIRGLWPFNNLSENLDGTSSADDIYGDGGNDWISAGSGADTALGGDGDDIIEGDGGNDTLSGNDGADIIDGGTGNDTINGGSGDDILTGGTGNDDIFGGSGSDTFYADAGDNLINGGSGYDTFKFADVGFFRVNTGPVTVFEDAWTNGVSFAMDSGYTWLLPTTAGGAWTFLGTNDVTNVERIEMTNQDDSFYGRHANGAMSIAWNGVQEVDGLGGNDFFSIASVDANDEGANTIHTLVAADGGSGTDTVSYYYATGGISTEHWNTEQDTIKVKFTDASSQTSLGGFQSGTHWIKSIENLGGTNFDDRIQMGNNDNTIEGRDGNDFLDGQGGRDTLLGGDGNDILRGGSGRDTLVGGAGRDTMTGGTEIDTFVFKAASDSFGNSLQRDFITDFAPSVVSNGVTVFEKIDLSAIDANAVAAGNQAFSYLGSGAFSGTAGQLRVTTQANENSPGTIQLVEADVNGDRVADFSVSVMVSSGALTANNFIF